MKYIYCKGSKALINYFKFILYFFFSNNADLVIDHIRKAVIKFLFEQTANDKLRHYDTDFKAKPKTVHKFSVLQMIRLISFGINHIYSNRLKF